MLNEKSPRIQQFISEHFADYTPEKYKLSITEQNGMTVVSYVNTKHNLSNVCYIAM